MTHNAVIRTTLAPPVSLNPAYDSVYSFKNSCALNSLGFEYTDNHNIGPLEPSFQGLPSYCPIHAPLVALTSSEYTTSPFPHAPSSSPSACVAPAPYALPAPLTDSNTVPVPPTFHIDHSLILLLHLTPSLLIMLFLLPRGLLLLILCPRGSKGKLGKSQ